MRCDRHDLERGILVVTDGVNGRLKGNLATHAVNARVIERVVGFNRSERTRSNAGTGRRNGGPGKFRSLRKK